MSNSDAVNGRRFAGDNVAITGGTSGIGLALVDAFLAEGASVLTCARSPDSLAAIQQDRPGLHTVVADVTQPEGRSAFLNAIHTHFGDLDIFVSNAGLLVEHDFARHEVSDNELASEFSLNLVAPVQLTASVLAQFERIKAITLVSSGYALVTPTRSPTYGAAKAGLHGFAEGLRRQLSERQIHVLEVLPPLVDTPATAHRSAAKISPESVAAETLSSLHARRPMALVGQTKWLPLLLRVMPARIADIVSKT
ncbi:MAG: SDR family NAD(P)-dependent oxidoreductase [Sphingobium sp.]